MLVIVDDREPPAVARRIEELLSDVMVTVERLRVGDIRIGPLTVERKTGPDFMSSWFTGHLQAQIADLVTFTKRPILAVHGDPGTALSKEEWDRISERVQTINLALPAYIFPTLDAMLLWIANRSHYLKSGEWTQYVKRPVRVAGPNSNPVVELYASLPHVGPELASRLAMAYPQPSGLVSALADIQQVMVIEGIGKQTATCLADLLLRGVHPHSKNPQGGPKATQGTHAPPKSEELDPQASGGPKTPKKPPAAISDLPYAESYQQSGPPL